MAQPIMPPPITTIRCGADADTGRFRVANHSAAASFKAVRLSIECSFARVTMWLPALPDNDVTEQSEAADLCQLSDVCRLPPSRRSSPRLL